MENMLYYQMNSEYLPVVIYTDKVTIEPPYVHMRRKTDEFILYYVVSGEMYLNEGNRQFILKTNDMMILDPNWEHYGTKATTCTFFTYIFIIKK